MRSRVVWRGERAMGINRYTTPRDAVTRIFGLETGQEFWLGNRAEMLAWKQGRNFGLETGQEFWLASRAGILACKRAKNFGLQTGQEFLLANRAAILRFKTEMHGWVACGKVRKRVHEGVPGRGTWLESRAGRNEQRWRDAHVLHQWISHHDGNLVFLF